MENDFNSGVKMKVMTMSELVDIISDLEGGNDMGLTIVSTPSKFNYKINSMMSNTLLYEYRLSEEKVYPEWINCIDHDDPPYSVYDICDRVKESVDNKLGLFIMNKGKIVKKYKPNYIRIVDDCMSE